MTTRIIGYDLARALAVFGMVLVNFKIVMCGEQDGTGWLATATGLLEGRAAATFVVLAGVGVTLLTRTGDSTHRALQRAVLWKRAALLFVIGLLYTPLWPADILHFYGVYLAAAALLITGSTRWLWTAAIGLVAGFVGLLLVFDYERGWDWQTLTYSGLWTADGMVRHLLFNGFHPVIPWLAFLLLGMILGRQDLACRLTRRRIMAWSAGFALAAELASRTLIAVLSADAAAEEQELIDALFGVSPMPPMPFYMLAAGGSACFVIACAVAIGERFAGSGAVRVLVSTGQLALTLYVAHVVIGMGILEAIGLLDNQPLPRAVLASVVFCVLGVAFAHTWRLRFERGPLEALLRYATRTRVREAAS